MSDVRTCESCEHTGSDVKVRLVRYSSKSQRVHDPVRTWFASEARCVDTAACDRRAKENE